MSGESNPLLSSHIHAGTIFSESPTDRPPTPPEESIRSDARPYNDVWAAVLWLVAVLLVVVYGIIGFGRDTPTPALEAIDGPHIVSPRRAALIALTAVLSALATALGLTSLARTHAAQVIYAGNGLLLGMYAAGCIGSAIAGQAGSAALLAIVFAVHAVFLYVFRERIRFAALCIETVARIVQRHSGMLLTSLGASVVQLGYLALWAAGVVQWVGASTDELRHAAFWPWLLFLFWGLQVFHGVVHATTCGVVAMWYFTGGAMPRNPTLGALRRALSFSFGSICFGALIVAVINTLCTVLRFLLSRDNDRNAFLKAVARYFLNLLESLAEYFNAYAFVHIAIYGTPYVESAKATWGFVRHSAFGAIINDDFTGTAVFMLMFLTAQVSGALSAVLFRVPGVEHGWAVPYATGLIIGFIVARAIFSVLVSGVMALFVCVAEQPDVIDRVNPSFANELKKCAATRRTESE